jgi:hypothetical protein
MNRSSHKLPVDFAVAGSATTCTGSLSVKSRQRFLGISGTPRCELQRAILLQQRIPLPAPEDGWSPGRREWNDEWRDHACREMGGGLTGSPESTPIRRRTGWYPQESILAFDGTARRVWHLQCWYHTHGVQQQVVLLSGRESVFWVLGTALIMGADSTLVGNVLAGSASLLEPST